jgi:hypothetical protein
MANPPGVGRPAGAKNKITTEVQGRLTAFVAENLEVILARLLEIITEGKAPDAVKAAQLVLDRGLGKQVEISTLEGSTDPGVSLSSVLFEIRQARKALDAAKVTAESVTSGD